MEGEKEREDGEEKESDEAEEWNLNQEDPEGAALAWQEGSGEDHLGLPIMHWEALSLRIAELEKQDLVEQKKPQDVFGSLEHRRRPLCWRDEGRRPRSSEVWEDREEEVHMTELTSRLQTRVNLQLCFINNSESDEEEEREENNTKRHSLQVPRQTSPKTPAVVEKSRPLTGFRNALRSLRDRLRTDGTRQAAAAAPTGLLIKRPLDRQDLQASDMKDVMALCVSLSQAIQDLNCELVALLQTRDHLRTEQDAMLLEVQDLTTL